MPPPGAVSGDSVGGLPFGENGFLDMSVFDETDPDEALSPEQLEALREQVLLPFEGQRLDERTWHELLSRVMTEPPEKLGEPE